MAQNSAMLTSPGLQLSAVSGLVRWLAVSILGADSSSGHRAGPGRRSTGRVHPRQTTMPDYHSVQHLRRILSPQKLLAGVREIQSQP